MDLPKATRTETPIQRLKQTLQAASESSNDPDQHWTAESVSRLYFYRPGDEETSGAVDVADDGGKAPARVRVELWCPPEMAEEVIALVTKSAKPAVKSLVQSVCDRPDNAGVPMSRRVIKSKQDEADEKRMEELTRLIAEQDEDDRLKELALADTETESDVDSGEDE